MPYSLLLSTAGRYPQLFWRSEKYSLKRLFLPIASSTTDELYHLSTVNVGFMSIEVGTVYSLYFLLIFPCRTCASQE
ncbi:hypothetical protein BN77_p10274 [Rhizobium mesoamericanum STM3625]|uniref:Uncharacterized protein n=1 Tax=Rhizobium mesoamericanum STM3625 TaxID=1211777 RepID=K0Q3Q1_9HYPH|nr:hypothetical protein BN77_p10274 [Rhizobium mesoamericanum STM3625]